jgi:dimethylamine corrinoid protein
MRLPYGRLRRYASLMIDDWDGERFIAALVDGDHVGALAEAGRLQAAGVPPELLVTEGLETAMQRVEDKCTVDSFNLLEIMLVGRAVSVVADTLYPQGIPAEQRKATLVIATPEGDIHDLGKTIVRMVLLGTGYRVVDLGRDCPVTRLVRAARVERAGAVLVSGLLTTVIPRVREVKTALSADGLASVKLLAGGAALKQATAEELDVDYVAQSAFDGARYLENLALEVTA